MGGRDPGTLRVLHDEHAGALWHYVFRLTHDRARSEDIVQETLLRAWRTDLADDGTGSVRAWLFTVARNLVIDDSRSARRRHEVNTDTPPDAAVADRTDALFDSMLVTEALHTLSMDHRTVVARAYFARQTVAEIADELDIPPGTVKSRLHYGLRALRLALQERGVTR
jgi:RNA polymerase sigma-70 factor (ECF subfamily)